MGAMSERSAPGAESRGRHHTRRRVSDGAKALAVRDPQAATHGLAAPQVEGASALSGDQGPPL